ncbi:choice-of-anchor W domain-containing protein [Crocosphaera chwakensis]|uniref:Uncharacterized protein n=1 Tax=Crocosphaera chwakensis CCY0110 TaxID=391612 RepID=A3INI0_9CHRO|nr:choice-of-anchor W domain-containing protein [Crocosphaera chwakensis]EAZ91878.1 hypothetical protein CY0110_29424 [Crocosphaera chwakensis CCY0110]
MRTLISSLKIATSSFILGLTVFNIKPLAAQTLFQSTIIAGADNYSDPTNMGINYGTSPFIQVGSRYDPNDPNNPPSGGSPSRPLILEEVGYINWNLSSIINDIKTNYPGAFLGNVDAVVTLTHTKTDPDNPNDTDPNYPDGRFFPDLPRIDNINAYQVTGNWNENNAINTNNRPARNNLILFDGNIEANPDADGDNLENSYGGIGLNQVVKSILNNNLDDDLSNDNPNLSIALEATEIFEATDFGFYALESFFSQNGNDDSVKPEITLRYELLQEGTKVEGGPNFKATTRGGGSGNLNGDWELGVFLGDNPTNDPNTTKKANWVWTNDELVDFELVCNPNTGGVTLTLSNGQTTATTPALMNNPCDKIDGLKIFSTARTNGAEMEIIVDEFTTLNDNVINVSNLSALAQDGSGLVEDYFAFPGVIEGQLGAKKVNGTVRMKWGPGGAPQNPRSGSNNQSFLIPLTRILNPDSPPQSLPESNQPTSEEIQQQRLELLSEASPNVTSVPESNSIVALVFFATTGVGVRLLSRK